MAEAGRQLRELREAKGLGLNEAARRAGMNPGILSFAEQGQRPLAGRWIGRLAEVLGPEVWQIVERDQLTLADAVRVPEAQEVALLATLRDAAKQQVLADLLAAADYEVMAYGNGDLYLRATRTAPTAAGGLAPP